MPAERLLAALGVSVQTVDRLRRAGRIPFVALGRGLARYDLDAVTAALTVHPAARIATTTASGHVAVFDFHAELEKRRRELGSGRKPAPPRSARDVPVSAGSPRACRPQGSQPE